MDESASKREQRPAIAYLRVSRKPQAQGAGFDLQLSQIKAFAQASGFHIAQIFGDVIRGCVPPLSRPEFKKAVEAAKALDAPILVGSFHRFSRDSAQYGLIDTLHVISAADGESVSGAAVASRLRRADEERRLIRSRTAQELQRLKAAGKKLGNLQTLEEHRAKGSRATAQAAEERFAILRHIERDLERQLGRCPSLDELATRANDLGERTGSGLEWSGTRLRRYRRRYPLAAPAALPVDATEPADTSVEEHRTADASAKNEEWGLW